MNDVHVVVQVLTSEGLLRYVDSRCIQRELSEVAGISEEEMDEAAHELLYMRQEDAPVAESQTTGQPLSGTARPPFYEHLGGYGMHELHDFNQYSSRPVATTSSSGSGVWWWWQRRRQRAANHNNAPITPQTTDETTMYVTSV